MWLIGRVRGSPERGGRCAQAVCLEGPGTREGSHNSKGKEPNYKMDKGREWTLPERRHINGHQTREKTVTISHCGNANQNQADTPPPKYQDGRSKAIQDGNSAGEDAETPAPSHTVGGKVKQCSYCGKQFGGSSTS